MNAAATFPMQARRAMSPYARRLAKENQVDLGELAGCGRDGRIVAADVLACQAPVAESPPEQPIPPPRVPASAFSAVVSLADLNRLSAEAARVGLDIAVEDAASRAASAALTGVPGGIVLEVDGRQIMINAAAGLPIGAERRLRPKALDCGTDVSAEPAVASLLILHSARVVPGTLPVLPGRVLRLVLVANRDSAQAHALLSVEGGAMTEARAIAVLEAFVDALEQPLALLA